MLTEHQLIKKLCSKRYIKHLYVKIPFLGDSYKPLKGFYLNEDKKVYFYADDRIGISFAQHYQSILVKDYLGRYRPFIKKFFENSDLTKVSYTSAFDLENTDTSLDMKGFYPLMVQYPDIQIGDFILEDPDQDEAANTIVHYNKIEDNNPLYEVFYMIQTPGQHLLPFGSIEKASFQHPNALEDYIYTLIPLDVKAYEAVH